MQALRYMNLLKITILIFSPSGCSANASIAWHEFTKNNIASLFLHQAVVLLQTLYDMDLLKNTFPYYFSLKL